MKTVFTTILIFIFSIVLCQNNTNGIDFSKPENDIYLKLKNEEDNFFSLESIKKSNSENIYRFWNTSNCIEISFDESQRSGSMYFAIKNTDSEDQFLRKKVVLTSEQIEEIINLYQNLKIENISTDEKINGWSHGFDGDTYQIESWSKKQYSLRNYWTPSIQDVEEANIILKFWAKLDEIVKTSEKLQQFLSENKFICYKYYGTAYSICKIMTKKEARKAKRLKRKL